MARVFVKSGTTKTSVVNSRGELERLLSRYGCSAFSVEQDYEAGQSAVSFVVPDSKAKGAVKVPVRLEIRAREVYDALYGQPTKYQKLADGTWGHAFDRNGYDPKLLAQAERVAWRQLILWVDAALSAATAGLQKVSEAFLAHTLIRGQDGDVRRMADHLDRVSGGSWKALLPASTSAHRD